MTSFLRLPAELRNQIYDLVIPSKQHVIWHLDAKPTWREVRYIDPDGKPTSPLPGNGSLLRACRQVYEESAPLLYERTEFFIATRVGYRACCPPRLFWDPPDGRVVVSTLAKIKHLTLHFDLQQSGFLQDDKIMKCLQRFMNHCPNISTISFEFDANCNISEEWRSTLKGLCHERVLQDRIRVTVYPYQSTNDMNRLLWKATEWLEDDDASGELFRRFSACHYQSHIAAGAKFCYCYLDPQILATAQFCADTAKEMQVTDGTPFLRTFPYRTGLFRCIPWQVNGRFRLRKWKT